MINLNLKEIHDGVFRTSYRGIPIQKFPFDYVIYQMIMNEIKPDLIIEIGTCYGGSALYFADLMDALNIVGGEIHTIDIIDLETRKNTFNGNFPNLSTNENYPTIIHSNPRIKQFTNGFMDYDLDNTKGFKTILVIDDGSHIQEEVLESLNKFKDIVSVGSYFIIEDSNILDLTFLSPEVLQPMNGGPLNAIATFLNSSNNFTIDLHWCDMFGINSTFNTYGYLKKYK